MVGLEILPSGSPFVINRQASLSQTVVLELGLSTINTHCYGQFYFACWADNFGNKNNNPFILIVVVRLEMN